MNIATTEGQRDEGSLDLDCPDQHALAHVFITAPQIAPLCPAVSIKALVDRPQRSSRGWTSMAGPHLGLTIDSPFWDLRGCRSDDEVSSKEGEFSHHL